MTDKILIVDDEPDTVNLAKMILERDGYHVISAYNWDDAIKKAESEMPDFIYLDMVMPGKSGLEVCKILKAQPKTKKIPVVMFTALGRDVDKKLSKEAGADGHFLKPFEAEDLIAEIKKHLKFIRPEKFSNTLELDHERLKGRKILLEFDPVVPYERVVRDFVMECQVHEEVIVLLGNKASVVYQTLQKYDGLEFIALIPQPILTPILETNAGTSVNIICDNLTDLIFSMGFQATYKFIKHTLERLTTVLSTALFLLNPKAHPSNETYSIRSLFSDQITFGKDGLTINKLT
ncbi:response regulator transcription factor [Candidatus Borrarchaeum sp.]|uniref:response regulator transcription factor n=1 Tax=Candidatus Borrarchaeum sp. TaxID=2846742 RepID=UPI00257BCE8D|nr:response regulator [Candidatus Borrarchaeum sp.]